MRNGGKLFRVVLLRMEDLLFSLPVFYQSNFSNVKPHINNVCTEGMILRFRMNLYLYILIQINMQSQFVDSLRIVNYGIGVEKEESTNILLILKMANIVNIVYLIGYL